MYLYIHVRVYALMRTASRPFISLSGYLRVRVSVCLSICLSIDFSKQLIDLHFCVQQVEDAFKNMCVGEEEKEDDEDFDDSMGISESPRYAPV